MNNDAFLYSNHDELQRIDADHILTTFSNLLKWKNSENVLDVGSADGGITTEILMPNLPKDFKKLVGVDIAEKMVAFANNNSKNNPKVEFHVLDITCPKLPTEFRHHFDHVFSFYCLNWIPEERYVPTNILNIIYIELCMIF
jgi:juvenile hormone acid methyltransferase